MPAVDVAIIILLTNITVTMLLFAAVFLAFMLMRKYLNLYSHSMLISDSSSAMAQVECVSDGYHESFGSFDVAQAFWFQAKSEGQVAVCT